MHVSVLSHRCCDVTSQYCDVTTQQLFVTTQYCRVTTQCCVVSGQSLSMICFVGSVCVDVIVFGVSQIRSYSSAFHGRQCRNHRAGCQKSKLAFWGQAVSKLSCSWLVSQEHIVCCGSVNNEGVIF